jgi:dihydroorotase
MESCCKHRKIKTGFGKHFLMTELTLLQLTMLLIQQKKRIMYTKCPSGAPLVQHSLVVMLENYKNGKISLEKIVEKMCHNPAILFRVEKRGFVREGYKADLVLVDLNADWTVSKDNLLYKCGWSPLEGMNFHSKVTHTFVNGHLVYDNGTIAEGKFGERLLFEVE